MSPARQRYDSVDPEQVNLRNKIRGDYNRKGELPIDEVQKMAHLMDLELLIKGRPQIRSAAMRRIEKSTYAALHEEVADLKAKLSAARVQIRELKAGGPAKPLPKKPSKKADADELRADWL